MGGDELGKLFAENPPKTTAKEDVRSVNSNSRATTFLFRSVFGKQLTTLVPVFRTPYYIT